MNIYMKVFTALLTGTAVGIETGWPHAAWAVPVVAAITAGLGTMHVALPTVPAAGHHSSTSTPVDAAGAGHVSGG